MNAILEVLNNAEAEYKKYKLLNELKQAQFLLTVNWGLINEERLELGLPKISNEAQRKAYLKEKYYDDNLKELDLELKYNLARREYESKYLKGL